MKQAEIKEVLMQSSEFHAAYMALKEQLGDTDWWYVDSLAYYPDFIPSHPHEQIKEDYGEFELVFATLEFPEKYPELNHYGFIIAVKEEE